jgi:hypothetical protein
MSQSIFKDHSAQDSQTDNEQGADGSYDDCHRGRVARGQVVILIRVGHGLQTSTVCIVQTLL